MSLAKTPFEAGKHGLLRMALGANTKEAEELAALAHKKNVRTMVGLPAPCVAPRILFMGARAHPARLRRPGASGET